MSNRTFGTAVLVGGVLTFLIALTADSTGFGTSPGIGSAQIFISLVGVALAAFGITRLRRG